MIILNLLSSSGLALPMSSTLDLRTKTNITVSGARTDGGLIIVSLGQGRAPTKVPIHASVAQMPRIDADPGETITLAVETDSGGKVQRWTSPALIADKAGILHVADDDRVYSLAVCALTQTDALNTRLTALETAFESKNKRSKNPSIGGNKI